MKYRVIPYLNNDNELRYAIQYKRWYQWHWRYFAFDGMAANDTWIRWPSFATELDAVRYLKDNVEPYGVPRNIDRLS